MTEGRVRARASRLMLMAAMALIAGCPKPIGYSLRPESVRNCRPQVLRIAVATFQDARPTEEKDFSERVRLVGDEESKGFTDFGDAGVGEKISTTVAKHLAFAGCFQTTDRVDLPSDENIDYLKRDIKKLSGDYDAVLLGTVVHLWGFNGTTTEGDRRVVKALATLTDIKIIRTRDLKMIWGDSVEAKVDELESDRPGNQYRIANETLRDALNKMVQDLNKQKLPLR